MFENDIVTVLTGDASVNALVNNNIVYNGLPVDCSTSEDWLVFSYTTEDNTRTLDRYTISNYRLQIQIVSKKIPNILNIHNALKSYLISYDNGSSIRDISFLNKDDPNPDLEAKVYYLTTNYNILYIG